MGTVRNGIDILFASPREEEAGMAAGEKRTFYSKDFLLTE